jgi:hypothetical protein
MVVDVMKIGYVLLSATRKPSGITPFPILLHVVPRHRITTPLRISTRLVSSIITQPVKYVALLMMGFLTLMLFLLSQKDIKAQLNHICV